MTHDCDWTVMRSPQPGEAEVCAALHVICWQEAYQGILPAPYLAALQPASRLLSWEQRCQDPTLRSRNRILWGLEGQALGFVSWGPMRPFEGEGALDIENFGEIYAIYMRKNLWGKGLGHALFETAKRALHRSNPHQDFCLWVLKNNTRSLDWYRRQGGQAVASRTVTLADTPFDEICLRFQGLGKS